MFSLVYRHSRWTGRRLSRTVSTVMLKCGIPTHSTSPTRRPTKQTLESSNETTISNNEQMVETPHRNGEHASSFCGSDRVKNFIFFLSYQAHHTTE